MFEVIQQFAFNEIGLPIIAVIITFILKHYVGNQKTKKVAGYAHSISSFAKDCLEDVDTLALKFLEAYEDDKISAKETEELAVALKRTATRFRKQGTISKGVNTLEVLKKKPGKLNKMKGLS